jgi:transcriptional regulator with XRE-family HTH domain
MKGFLRSIQTEADMADAFAKRRLELGYLQEQVEFNIGLTHGHLGKIEAGDKKWGKRPFRIDADVIGPWLPISPVTMSATLIWLLEHYNLKLLLVDKELAEEVLEVDHQHMDRTHRDKASQVTYQNASRMTISKTRRPRRDPSESICGAFLPESTRPVLRPDS